MGKVLYSIPLSTLLRTVALWCSRYSSRIKQVIVGRSLTVLTICSCSFFLSFRFKVEQWLILAILVFVLVILFARVCRVISRPLCHDTLSRYCGTIVIWIHRAELSLFSSILPYLWLWVYLSDPVALWVRPVHSLASLNFAGLATFH